MGIEFANSNPQIWYPGNRKHVAIQLNLKCQTDFNEGVYELAHEALHCLSPTGGHHANVLEEGMATFFAIQYCSNNGYGNNYYAALAANPLLQNYKNAHDYFVALNGIDPDIIKRVRIRQPIISVITAADLIHENNLVPVALADLLTAVF